MNGSLVISHVQTGPLLREREAVGEILKLSPDLGLSSIEVEVSERGLMLPNGELLDWATIEEVDASPNNCYLIRGGQAEKVLAFSEHTGRVVSLMPTTRAPTMLVSGIPMHRIKGTDPSRDTAEKIKAIRPVTGEVLDTTTGLGYTAIEAAKSADLVTTIELDPTVLSIARLNPWSQGLFDNPRISQVIGDSFEVVQELEDSRFSRIVHDPPAFSLAGQLYSGEFYGQLHRVLRSGGRLFHYVGSPDTKSGRNITRGVSERLLASGFSRVRRRPRAFGLLAHK
jgi:predicted methyltransferase